MAKPSFTPEEKYKIIVAFRTYLTDDALGTVLNLTRERIAQIGGRRRANRIRRIGQYDQEIKRLTLEGYSVADIMQHLAKSGVDMTYGQVTTARERTNCKLEGRKIRLQKRIALIESRLKEFIATGTEFKGYQIAKWDYNLHAMMQRTPPGRYSHLPIMEQWAKHMGIPWKGYTIPFKESRLKK